MNGTVVWIRRRFSRVCSVVVMATMVGFTGACAASDDEAVVAEEPVPSVDCQFDPGSSTGVTEPVDAPEGEVIEVVESGASYVSTDTGIRVRHGATLRNTSDLIAKDVHVYVRGYIGDRSVGFHSSAVVYLLPGQIHAVGSQVRYDGNSEIDRFEVEFVVEEWWPIGNDVFQPHEIVPFDVEFADPMETDYFNREESDLVRFSAYSCNPEETGLYGALIVRDSEGKIVGASGIVTETRKCDDAEVFAHKAPSGWHSGYCFFNWTLRNEHIVDYLDHDIADYTPEMYLYSSADLA